MLDIKTSAVVLALLGAVVYESNSHSASTAKFEQQIETLHDRVRLLSEAQSTTHESIKHEALTRKEEVGQLKNLQTDPALGLKAQVELWDRQERWVVYYRHGYCQKIVAKSAADAEKIYNGVSKDYAKILYHDGKVLHKFGQDEWTLNCIQTADRSHQVAELESQQTGDHFALKKLNTRFSKHSAASKVVEAADDKWAANAEDTYHSFQDDYEKQVKDTNEHYHQFAASLKTQAAQNASMWKKIDALKSDLKTSTESSKKFQETSKASHSAAMATTLTLKSEFSKECATIASIEKEHNELASKVTHLDASVKQLEQGIDRP